MQLQLAGRHPQGTRRWPERLCSCAPRAAPGRVATGESCKRNSLNSEPPGSISSCNTGAEKPGLARPKPSGRIAGPHRAINEAHGKALDLRSGRPSGHGGDCARADRLNIPTDSCVKAVAKHCKCEDGRWASSVNDAAS
eukprot:10730175-Alexandrium_andersonii.AAC.1